MVLNRYTQRLVAQAKSSSTNYLRAGPLIRDDGLMTFSRSLITAAAATAMARSGVTIAQTASA